MLLLHQKKPCWLCLSGLSPSLFDWFGSLYNPTDLCTSGAFSCTTSFDNFQGHYCFFTVVSSKLPLSWITVQCECILEETMLLLSYYQKRLIVNVYLVSLLKHNPLWTFQLPFEHRKKVQMSSPIFYSFADFVGSFRTKINVVLKSGHGEDHSVLKKTFKACQNIKSLIWSTLRDNMMKSIYKYTCNSRQSVALDY